MRRMNWVAAVGVVVLAGTAVGAGVGRADGDGGKRAPRACSDASLRGAYGLQFQGTRPVRPPFPPGTEAFIGIAIRTYDGEGQFTQISNVKGAVIGVEADVESTGTYQVNEDCSGSDTLQPFDGAPVVTDRLVIVDNGREVPYRRDDTGCDREHGSDAEDPQTLNPADTAFIVIRDARRSSEGAYRPRRGPRASRPFGLPSETLARFAS